MKNLKISEDFTLSFDESGVLSVQTHRSAIVGLLEMAVRSCHDKGFHCKRSAACRQVGKRSLIVSLREWEKTPHSKMKTLVRFFAAERGPWAKDSRVQEL